MMTTEIEAAYRVTTPLFCGGANSMETALRLPSFKGVLRFWWRALAWSRHQGDLEAIRQQEARLFGSAGGGQGLVSMQLAPDSGGSTVRIVPAGQVLHVSGAGGVVGEGARYLGYGVMEAFSSTQKATQAGQLTRSCRNAPVDLIVQMRFRGREASCEASQAALNEQVASMTDALVCLGTLGGMGAKSRKGYGSLVIRSLRVNGEERWRPPQTVQELRDALSVYRRQCAAANLPEYTALSRGTRCVLVSADTNEALGLLDLVGREMVRYRSWGHGGTVFKADSERNFKDDHDLMKTKSQFRENRHPRRIAFGLPHNYGRNRDQQVDARGSHGEPIDRRASPLFIHVHECGDRPIAVLSFLPARFLPAGASISVGGRGVQPMPEERLYRPIHDFLDRLLDRKKRKERFTEVVEVTS